MSSGYCLQVTSFVFIRLGATGFRVSQRVSEVSNLGDLAAVGVWWVLKGNLPESMAVEGRGGSNGGLNVGNPPSRRDTFLKDEMTLKSRGPIPIYYESLYGI